ncbi:MAG: N-acetylglucosamine-6-phosphate deacetylase [Candidatus Binatus sp.]|nr:N-acetylglucosamine-6-phosphate deacetylase [Candidatus Binatus sp.]
MNHLAGMIARPDGSTIRGRIVFGERIEHVDTSAHAGDDYILPGLIDLQVNGSHGIDVMNASPDLIAKISRALAAEGTTAWLPTVVTAPMEKIERAHDSIAAAMEASSGLSSDSAPILGMHLEGPFISPVRLGAHPKLNLEPRGADFERVLAMKALRLITLAPELSGAIDATRRLVDRGVIVSIGHTNATFDEAVAGVEAGARMFTHLFNAMRPLNQRDPGVIAAALDPSCEAFPAIIADGVHVHPEMIRLALHARGPRRMMLVTDKVALAGTSGDSSNNVGRGRAAIRDGAARLADGTLAGSIISMLDAVRLMVNICGVSLGNAAVMASTNPANLIGANDRGCLEAGARADLIVLDRRFDLKAVFIGGQEVSAPAVSKPRSTLGAL